MSARLKSAIWVSAFLRQKQVEGLYGAVIRKGAEEAGAVFVIVNHLDRTLHLFGPAPGPAYSEEGDRRWTVLAAPPAGQAEVDGIIAKHIAFDPDLWLVEIEDRTGTGGLVDQSLAG